jgi:6-pyruvoyltetrahydropterin/6-carboxytetrahydropterin synthase
VAAGVRQAGRPALATRRLWTQPKTTPTFQPMQAAFLTRRLRFSAAHRYHRPEWSEERNYAVFGPCSRPHGHGHNYTLEVTVSGEVDATTGFVVDLSLLDRVLEEEVHNVLDHRHINHAVPEFAEGGMIPTSENLLIYLWPRIGVRLPGAVSLHRLRLSEDETFFVDYFGGGEP